MTKLVQDRINKELTVFLHIDPDKEDIYLNAVEPIGIGPCAYCDRDDQIWSLCAGHYVEEALSIVNLEEWVTKQVGSPFNSDPMKPGLPIDDGPYILVIHGEYHQATYQTAYGYDYDEWFTTNRYEIEQD